MGKWIGIGLALVVLVAVAFIAAAYIFPDFRVASRDIAIIVLAVFQIISAILLIALLLAVLYAVRSINRLAHESVAPRIDALSTKLDQVIEQTRGIAGNLKDTTATVSTTTTYVAERAVAPVIRVSGLVAGVRAAATFLARRGHSPDDD